MGEENITNKRREKETERDQKVKEIKYRLEKERERLIAELS